MSIYMHFHPDEHRFVDRAQEWIEDAAARHKIRLTDFLDPRQAHIVMTLANRNGDVTLRLDGGYAEAERRRALIAPDYIQPDDADMEIRVLSVTSADARTDALDHGDYMGAILGLGIKRDKIGDIHVLEQGCHCLVTEDIATFLHLHLQQVHRLKVMTEVIPLHALQTSESQLQEMTVSVASLRLDGIVGDVFRLSRAKALIPIKAGRLRVNWKVEEDPSKQLKEGDIVSLQGFGRFRVVELQGESKSGRLRLRIAKYV